jgi:hypothetical protein
VKSKGIFILLVLILVSSSIKVGGTPDKAEEELKRLRSDVIALREEVNRLKEVIRELQERLSSYEAASPVGQARKKESKLKSNMHTLQLVVEDFSTLADGAYPLDINSTVEKVNNWSKGDLRSISDAYPHDPAKGDQINKTGNALLPEKGNFVNPFNPTGPAVATSFVDPPTWLVSMIGVVWYVPIEVKDAQVLGYKIYGAGEKGLLDLILKSR